MKKYFCTVIGLGTLLIFMAADFLTGTAAAAFGRSPKTPGGGLDSRAGWLGLCRKGLVLLLVLVGHRLDLTLGTDYVRNTVIIGFMVNELLSVTENVGVLGVPMPGIIKRMIELLKNEEEKNDRS